MKENENNYTISETYELPSKGLVYNTPIDPVITLRSMTTAEEMRRLSASDAPYKVMSDIIEACIVGDKPAIPVYDMCLGDYQYLLHKLRTVTYGADYKMTVKCPVCGKVFDTVCDLDALEVIKYDDNMEDLKTVSLPMSKTKVKLKMQTPRMLDEIAQRKKDLLKKNPEMTVDPGFLLTLESIIETVDGQALSTVAMEKFVRRLPMKDANILMQKEIKLNESVGLNTNFDSKCPACGFEMVSTFRITPEFFGPTID